MSAFKNEALNEARECWQNASSGFALRASMPYGVVEDKPISKADFAVVVLEAKLAFDRLTESMKILAEESKASASAELLPIKEADFAAVVKSMDLSIEKLEDSMEFLAQQIDQMKYPPCQRSCGCSHTTSFYRQRFATISFCI